jgi:hypothetical protein
LELSDFETRFLLRCPWLPCNCGYQFGKKEKNKLLQIELAGANIYTKNKTRCHAGFYFETVLAQANMRHAVVCLEKTMKKV